jgi:periplasmic protein CpxP/Spy
VMRRSMSVLMVGLAACLAVGPVMAQQGGRGRGRGADNLSLLRLPAPLAEKLQLSDDQKSKLTALQEKARADAQAARQSAAGDNQAAMQKTREINMKAEADAAAPLNADQQKNWETWRTEHRAVAGLGRSATALLMVTGLSDEQKDKLKTLATETQTKRRDLLQGGGGNTPEVRQKVMALDTETQTAIKGILNGDQAKQYEAGLAALPQPRRRQNQ